MAKIVNNHQRLENLRAFEARLVSLQRVQRLEYELKSLMQDEEYERAVKCVNSCKSELVHLVGSVKIANGMKSRIKMKQEVLWHAMVDKIVKVLKEESDKERLSISLTQTVYWCILLIDPTDTMQLLNIRLLESFNQSVLIISNLSSLTKANNSKKSKNNKNNHGQSSTRQQYKWIVDSDVYKNSIEKSVKSMSHENYTLLLESIYSHAQSTLEAMTFLSNLFLINIKLRTNNIISITIKMVGKVFENIFVWFFILKFETEK